MEALVTGAGGFVGGHLLAFLRAHTDLTLHGTLHRPPVLPSDEQPGVHLYSVDLCDPAAVRALLESVRPARIFHLAGQAYVPRSFEAPWETFESNVRSQLNVLQAVHELGLEARILVVGSAEMYGAARPEDLPLTETTPFLPSSPYSVSKIAQDMLALQYYRSYRLYTVRVRPFNHIGPGQNGRFAVASFAAQIAQIEIGKSEPVVYVGNLSAERDFTDVRDIVRAYYLALEQGEPGAVYNVCSGAAYSMQFILDHLLTLSTHAIEIRRAPDRMRPVEIPRLVGDYGRLHQQTGWQPQVSLAQTLHDVLVDWRQRLSTAQADRS